MSAVMIPSNAPWRSTTIPVWTSESSRRDSASLSVARRLKRHGLEYRTERVPLSKSRRAGVIELTGQKRVPVLVEGDEVIHDSRRIRQYLDHTHSEPE